VSQSVEALTLRTGYPTAAGVLTIVSACLYIGTYLLELTFTFSYQFSSILWSELPSLAVGIMLGVLAVLGGASALVRKRLVFAVFGAAVILPESLSFTTFVVVSLARALMYGDFTISVPAFLYIALSPVALVLSALSLVFLAKSRSEFS
jgi:hypothetical protein